MNVFFFILLLLCCFGFIPEMVLRPLFVTRIGISAIDSHIRLCSATAEEAADDNCGVCFLF